MFVSNLDTSPLTRVVSLGNLALSKNNRHRGPARTRGINCYTFFNRLIILAPKHRHIEVFELFSTPLRKSKVARRIPKINS